MFYEILCSFFLLNFIALGDPLIKGLTEVANKRPDDPIAYLATYLYNFANSNRGGRLRTQVSFFF